MVMSLIVLAHLLLFLYLRIILINLVYSRVIDQSRRSVLSQKFLKCLLNVLTHLIMTDDLQFGFINGKECQKAILVRSTVLYYFNENGSNVFIVWLDVSKAFDSVNHYGIFVKLINFNIPVRVLNNLINWYGKLSLSVRWACVLS